MILIWGSYLIQISQYKYLFSRLVKFTGINSANQVLCINIFLKSKDKAILRVDKYSKNICCTFVFDSKYTFNDTCDILQTYS